MKIHYNVGDVVFVKMTVKSISKQSYGEDYYVELEYPDWFHKDKSRTINVTASQHVIYGKEDEEEA